jgi:hypothetical protein
MASTNYYDRFIPEALMWELKKRVEGRLREELIPLADKIISDEVANSAINLMEWVSTTHMDRHVSITIQQPERKADGTVSDGKK